MTPVLKRGSRSRPSTIALEESAGRRSRKRTRSTNSLPLSSEPPSVILSPLTNRSRSHPRSAAQKLLDRRVEGPTEDPKVPVLTDRMAPDTTTTVETQTLTVGALENLNGPLRPSLSGTRRKHNGHASDRDSESSLSDIGEDSEAETERLHNSPQKQRPKLVVHNRKDSSSTTPAIAIEMPARKDVILDQEDAFADDVAGDSTPSTPTHSSPSKKRKREIIESPIVQPTEEPKTRPVTPPQKKKSHTPQAPEISSTIIVEGEKSNVDEAEPPVVNGVHQDAQPIIVANGKDVRAVKVVKVATPTVEESDSNLDQEQESERVPEVEMEENTDVAIPIPPEEEPGDTVDAIGVDDEDVERALRKKAAMEELAEIERVFAHLKDRIYSEKLRRVEIEMKMIQDGTHPEYVAQKACIDQKLDERVRLADAQYKYGMESLDTATRVSKAQVHSQYFQRVRELRETTLHKCSELWYHIQRERRAGDTLVSEYTYRIPDRASTRIQHRRQYNWEVALLTGISKHVGFPAAPDVLGASEEERAEDLEAIGIAPRVPVRASATVPPVVRDRMLDDHYERPQPIHWAPTHPSPPSPAPQAAQTHSHPHVHIHHHHGRRHVASGVPNQPEQPPYLKQRVPSAQGIMNPGHPQPSHVPLPSLLQNDGIKLEHPSPRPPPALALSIGNGHSHANRSPQHVHNHMQSQQPQRPPLQYYSAHGLQSHPLSQPSQQQHINLYARANSMESHQGPPPPQRIIDLGSPTPGEVRMYGREAEAPDGGLRRMKEENDGTLGVGSMPTAPMRFGPPRINYS